MMCYVKAYFDWIEQTAALSDAERGRLFIAILEYARSGREPKLDGRESILFPAFKATIDRDKEKSHQNALNGAKGGLAKSSKSKQKLAKSSKVYPTKDKDKDKDKEEDKDGVRELSDPKSLNKTSSSSDPTGCGEADALPPAAELELVDGTLFQISQKDVVSLSTAYPDVEVLQQLREMEIWTQANPQNRKTARGIKRFVCSWLSREQDKAAARKNAPGKPGTIAPWAPGELEKQAIARMMGNFEGGAESG